MSSSSLLWCLLVVCVLTVVQIYAAEEPKVLKVFNLRASDLDSDLLGIPDAYVEVFRAYGFLGRTEVKNNNADPSWEEEFSFLNAHENNTLRLEVYDSDIFFDDLLGTCECSIKIGTWQHQCFLKTGGTLYYSYILEPLQ
ncbi:GTPase activating protein 1-like [Salmo trutta]|uniref:GTPase activating protein 1-like n=1 Tax=Salmo trutta TaxID=8032 RepID=A0A673WID8_SALTR|nr:GTPase activating protein 1-like isoform X2 [Salmo trutta]XP_029619585.1 GTPase activating protein 1-like [Salmo trutta]